MNEMLNTMAPDLGLRGDTNARKKAYSQPKLVLFGQVAALTQSQSGCDQGDNPGCAVVTGNMGATMM